MEKINRSVFHNYDMIVWLAGETRNEYRSMSILRHPCPQSKLYNDNDKDKNNDNDNDSNSK